MHTFEDPYVTDLQADFRGDQEKKSNDFLKRKEKRMELRSSDSQRKLSSPLNEAARSERRERKKRRLSVQQAREAPSDVPCAGNTSAENSVPAAGVPSAEDTTTG